ncbi:hypothetical protein [Desulfonatronospira sp.]|uniref:hypothetical protein n=1 Tax=Desulfonatronospira sp. TaxID=1962951 RepID=UPI0025C3002D|nr:hypothetical protein [Desulfonatronospira sp.]
MSREFDTLDQFTGTLEMSITEAVSLALSHNRNIDSAYRDRVMQKFNLRRDLTKVHPDLEITLGADGSIIDETTDYRSGDTPDARTTIRSAGTFAETRVTQTQPAGAELSFVWESRA